MKLYIKNMVCIRCKILVKPELKKPGLHHISVEPGEAEVYEDVTGEQLKVNLSDYLSEKLHLSYTYLAHLFSEVKGTTIEKFYLAHTIEKVKELLVYSS